MFAPFNFTRISVTGCIIALILFVSLLVGCGNNFDNTSNIKPAENATLFTTYQNGDETVVQTSDGAPGLDTLQMIALGTATDHSAITFEVKENNNANPDARYRAGKYYYDFRWEKHWVYGCINRNVYHINLHIKDTTNEREIVNLHLCVWYENGPQFGIYNSANGACAKTPGTFTKIRQTVESFLSRMTPLPAWAYVPIAYTAAVVVGAAYGLAL